MSVALAGRPRGPERVLYKLALMVHRCLQDKAPQYLSNYCVPVSEVASRHQLSRKFFNSTLQPTSPLHSLLPPPQDQ